MIKALGITQLYVLNKDTCLFEHVDREYETYLLRIKYLNVVFAPLCSQTVANETFFLLIG